MHMVTIRDVARHAGVSVATVSRVINKTGHVSKDLTQRVQQAIDALGFEPDFLARTWRTRVTHTVAAVISDNTSPHHGIALREAASVALAHDYNLILCTTFRDVETERRYLQMLRTRRVDGVLLNNVGDCHSEIQALTDVGVPVVLLNRPLAEHGPMVDAVVVDSYHGSFDLVEHLIAMGHRRIAMAISNQHEFHKQERIRGYRQALQGHGLPCYENLVRSVERGHDAAMAEIIKLLALSPRPTALYATGYDCGLAAMNVFRQQGLQVPSDIAFAMFDDVAWGEFVDPPLTLVRNPAGEMGRLAMELLFARIADHRHAPQEIRLRPELVVRQSSASRAERPETSIMQGSRPVVAAAAPS
jgi:LacI family transcriptional regulator